MRERGVGKWRDGVREGGEIGREEEREKGEWEREGERERDTGRIGEIDRVRGTRRLCVNV